MTETEAERAAWYQAHKGDLVIREAPASALDVEARLAELAALPADWDSHGAKPVEATAIEMARRVIAAADRAPWWISPLPDGSVTVEWRAGRRTVEIDIVPDSTPREALVTERGVITYLDERRIDEADVPGLLRDWLGEP